MRYLLRAIATVPVVAAIAFSACSGDDSEGETEPTIAATNGAAPRPTPQPQMTIEQAIARAGAGLSNVRWNGEGEPEIVRFEALPEGYERTAYVTGLSKPTNIDFAPDGRMFVAEQHTGAVRVVTPDGQLLPEPFAKLPNPAVMNELGTVGLVVHPNFPDPAWVYVFHVEAGSDGQPINATVYRFIDDGGVGVDQTTIIELPPTTTDKHNGGGMAFGPDGKLYVTIGDLDTAGEVQLLDSLAGKMLRLNDDGSVPDDNPFAGNPDADERVFAYGFRNTYGLDWHPGLGTWVGADNATVAFDEINLIEPGGNYGHPDQRGYYLFRGDPGVIRFPVQTYLLAGGVSGLAVYDGDLLPEFTGDVFMCQIHRGAVMHRIQFDDAGTVTANTIIANNCSGDVVVGPDGAIYFVDVLTGNIGRIGRTEAAE